MPTDALYSALSIWPMLPEMVLCAAGCAALLTSNARNETLRRAAPAIALAALVVGVLLLRGWPTVLAPMLGMGETIVGGGLELGHFAEFVRVSALVLGVLFVLTSWSLPSHRETGEYFCMLLFSVAGLMLVGSASDLVILFMALELVSVPTYVMVTLSRSNPRGLEAGTKYFYLGAMAAAVTAYGFAFLYGATGQASIAGSIGILSDILTRPTGPAYVIATIGLVLSIGGLLFKLAAFPLHFYVADVYQGAAAPVAGLLGFVPKAAGIVAVIKIIEMTGWRTDAGGLFWMLWWVAALSMTIGNTLALRQTNIKRMLAYSGIAHAGYMLVGILAGPAAGGMLGDGAAAALYYVVIYGIANLGAFVVLGLLHVNGEPCETLRDVAGLLRRQPGLAWLLALTMFTLMGLPPTPGFWGKLSLFGSALSTATAVGGVDRTWVIVLVIVALINSAIGAAYYLRVAAAVLLYENEEPAEALPREEQRTGAVLCGLLLLIFMVYPNVLLDAGQVATSHLRVYSYGTAQHDAPPSASDLEASQRASRDSGNAHRPG
ncbi:MAG: NADH-quinone oxidoreductase subunit N [Phycisphaerae bacterium]